jgi:hypothetical protein
MREPFSIDREIARLAGRQHGIVSRDQLLAAGVDRGRIDRAIAAGRLLRVHTSVYAAGFWPTTDKARWMAAVLACSPDGVLSHHSAAALWRLPVRDNGLTRVTTTHRRRARASPCTAPTCTLATTPPATPSASTTLARTLAAISHSLDDERYHRAVKEAQFRG